MKTEKEINEEIKRITEGYWHVLDCYLATTEINSPRALMQVSAKAQLDVFYFVLGKKRSKFKCDEFDKQNY